MLDLNGEILKRFQKKYCEGCKNSPCNNHESCENWKEYLKVIEKERQELTEGYISFCCDMVPYDSPTYKEDVRKLAEACADEDLNGYPTYREYVEEHPEEFKDDNND